MVYHFTAIVKLLQKCISWYSGAWCLGWANSWNISSICSLCCLPPATCKPFNWSNVVSATCSSTASISFLFGCFWSEFACFSNGPWLSSWLCSHTWEFARRGFFLDTFKMFHHIDPLVWLDHVLWYNWIMLNICFTNHHTYPFISLIHVDYFRDTRPQCHHGRQLGGTEDASIKVSVSTQFKW